MARPKHITPDYLRRLLSYDPETGDLCWKTQHTNRVVIGRPIRTRIGRGYYAVQVDGFRMRVHNVVWAMHYGEWPDKLVDHINCDKTDNRISNLRLATLNQNAFNVGKQSNNTTGAKGVSKNGTGFKAEISANNVSHYLGTFKTVEEARRAYLNAAVELHGDYMKVD